ncbi:MAG TPA: hypothetical protein VG223_02810 [Solirubrobacteraceae bacterium]|nr:hypothetical protein [Solirubrobacteraceae bacterium]
MEQPLETAPGWRTPDAILDWLPPFVIGLEGLVAVEITRNHGGKTGWLLLALCVSTFALRWRRRASLPVLAATLAMALIVDWGPVATLPMLIAVFTAAEYGDRTRQAIAAAAGAIGIVLAPVLHGVDESAPTIGSRLVAVGLAVALGMYFRTRADHLGGLRDRAARAERERELLAEQAVAAERVRIARSSTTSSPTMSR